MPKTPTICGQVCIEYIKRFPTVGNLPLARKIHNENKGLFKNVEAARERVRYYRGAVGNTARNALKDKTMVKDFSNNFSDLFSIKKGEKNNFKPYKIPANIKKVGVISDVHIPYHDKEALLLALEYLKKQKIDCLVILGDLIDFYQVSFWLRDPRKRGVKYEMDMARQFLKDVRAVFGDILIIYKEGNHEERYEKYLKSHAAELLDNPEFRLDIVLRLEELKIKWVGNKRILHLGKLNMGHGHEFGRQIWNPVNPARGYFLKAKNNFLGADKHQITDHSGTDLNGKVTAAWSIGCLCDLHPEYAPINEWSHGFAVVTMRPGRNFQVENKKIIGEHIL